MNFIMLQKRSEKIKKNFNSACRLIGLFNLSKDEWDKFKNLAQIYLKNSYLRKLMKD